MWNGGRGTVYVYTQMSAVVCLQGNKMQDAVRDEIAWL